MDEKRQLLRHFLAALAYRTQKALRGAPADFGGFRAAAGLRTPVELVCDMTSVLGYARTFLVGGEYRRGAARHAAAARREPGGSGKLHRRRRESGELRAPASRSCEPRRVLA